MKTFAGFLQRVYATVKAQGHELAGGVAAAGWGSAKGESLLMLHEAQDRVIVGIFKICIGGCAAFLLILFSFTLFVFVDPFAPRWVGMLMLAVQAMLAFGLVRLTQEYRVYRAQYADISLRLREKVRQRTSRAGAVAPRPAGKPGEPRLVSVLKPREHQGWDAKLCGNCAKTLELTAKVCQHCGQEQETLLAN